MRYLKVVLGAVFVLSNLGCASYFLRKQCEDTNWFQHGHKVAMSGKRLDADDFIRQCQKAEAKMSFSEADAGFKAGMGKYCTADNIFAVGKSGKRFSFELCDGQSKSKMRGKYDEGLRAFCTPESGYRYGASGEAYEEVCPPNLESAFLPEYRKGRKTYLTAAAQEKERELQRLSDDLQSLESRRRSVALQQSIYLTSIGFRRQTDMTQGQKDQMRQFEGQLSSIDNELRALRTKKNSLNEQIEKMRTEAATL